MKIVNKKLSIAEFLDYIAKKDFGVIPPSKLVIHHTWKPDVKDWNGQKTIDGLKTFYEGKGWSAAPHIFVAEDGIWLFTDMYDVGIHASEGNAAWKSKKTGNVWYGWGNDYANNTLLWYSIGIEVVGDYDTKVWSGKTKENALAVIKGLQDRLKIDNSEVHFHNEYDPKTCPGKMITKDWLFTALKASNSQGTVGDDEAKNVKELLDFFGDSKRLDKSLGDHLDSKDVDAIKGYVKDVEAKASVDVDKLKKQIEDLTKENDALQRSNGELGTALDGATKKIEGIKNILQ